MKTGFFILVISLFLALGTKAQKTDQKPNSPQKKSTVKREYDQNGNLVKFDSTYTYSWSGDTTLNKTVVPENEKIQEFFSEHLNNKGDTSSFESQFPEGFNGFFSKGFGSKQDSLFMKKFGSNLHFQGLPFDPDSLALSFKDFDGFFDPFTEVPGDSISSKSGKSPKFSTPKSMEDMMKMLKQHMQEMQKHQQEIFDNQKNWKKL